MSPAASAALRSMSTTAAAASLTPEALPAVTVPSFLKAGRIFARSSRVDVGRMCSSVSMITEPLRLLISTGTICSLKRPSAMAAAARRWLCTASASWSSRETCHFSATFSAVMPMCTLWNGSVSAATIASIS